MEEKYIVKRIIGEEIRKKIAAENKHAKTMGRS